MNCSISIPLIEVSAELGFVTEGNIRRKFLDRLRVCLIEGVRVIGVPLNWGLLNRGFTEIKCHSNVLLKKQNLSLGATY